MPELFIITIRILCSLILLSLLGFSEYNGSCRENPVHFIKKTIDSDFVPGMSIFIPDRTRKTYIVEEFDTNLFLFYFYLSDRCVTILAEFVLIPFSYKMNRLCWYFSAKALSYLQKLFLTIEELLCSHELNILPLKLLLFVAVTA